MKPPAQAQPPKQTEMPPFPPRVWLDNLPSPFTDNEYLHCKKDKSVIFTVPYLSLQEHEALLLDAIKLAELKGRIKALKFADTYTDGAYAGIKAELAQCEAKAEKEKL